MTTTLQSQTSTTLPWQVAAILGVLVGGFAALALLSVVRMLFIRSRPEVAKQEQPQ